MAGEYIFSISQLTKTYGHKKVLENINLSFYHGAKIGIVGENGSGKTTLLRIMGQEDKEFDGRAEPLKGTKIGFLHQEPHLDKDKTVRQVVEEAFSDIKKMIDEFNEVSASMANPMEDDEMEKAMEKMGRLQDEIDAVNGWELDRQVEIAMDALVLPADDQPAGTLSGGEARRVALCRLLLQKPDIILLDEPTNHLDAETVAWLENTLQEFPGNVLVSTHDRYFLDNITKWILELDNGRGIPFEGNYSSWLEQKSERLRQKDKAASGMQKRLEKELEWIRATPAGRRGKNKSRISDYEKLSQSQQTADDNSLDIQIQPGPNLGEKVIVASGLCKGFNGNPLIEGLDFSIPRGAIVGLIGPNGTGKTTLFRMIVGEEKPDAGTLEVGSSVALSYVDQHRDDLASDKTVFEEITQGDEEIEIAGRKLKSRAYVSRFNFRGTDQQKEVGKLSGGERNRVHLAKLLRRSGNVLLLDEPTNDLDVTTLSNLENAILNFNGCVLVISHDRFFLDRICTHLLVFEGDNKVRWYEGNFEEYQQTRKKELGGREENRRSKYKKLTLQK
ncbi:MAG: energy-dependent translational throttle protein EttA [Candidatus Nitronauta litoralis]|uniref:Energy-dependent translational throttle protein EttA n=1 Tax=Candidatus Nitronauta litoralis TaxID=2705533 RepID=A0A7T0BW24_9BACT|nr:MAG: energy-dependent translational throttle protein EttA [Candidatus Nitronauta litoralis]